jgi:hypothetical protein
MKVYNIITETNLATTNRLWFDPSMTDNKQVVCQLTQQKPRRVLVVAPSELAIHHRHRQSFQTPPNLSNCIFKVIAKLSIVSAMLFGISALGYWGLEIVEPTFSR